tara:strand:- start:3638 stop:3868 length:231 start_codon:yes stop_codon:yes gene_type:complete
MDLHSIKIALVQGLIVLVPTYIMAFLTDKMVWTIPMLAAASFVAASIKKDLTERKIDEDGMRKDNESGHHPDIEDG